MNDPVDIVNAAFDGIEAGQIEIVADTYGAAAKRRWPANHAVSLC